MNLSLVDPFVLLQDYPDNTTASLRSGHATCLRFNRKGDFLASGRADGLVVIFDVETNGVVRKLKGHLRQVQSLCWSRDGRYLLTGSQDWKCNIWDLQNGSIIRRVMFKAPVYMAEFHPWSHFKFVVALYDAQPLYVDATDREPIKYQLPSIPKRTQTSYEDDPPTEKQAAADAKIATTAATFTESGQHILTGTNKGFLNIIETESQEIIYSTKIAGKVIIYMRLSGSGRDIVVNVNDGIVRTVQLPNLTATDLDPDTIDVQVEHKFQDVVNRLSWNHCAFSATGEYVTASTFNNHDIYIWERRHGSLVKILEGPKEECGVVEWHPTRPLIAACGVETGRIHIWSIIPQQRWSALAPDFLEVEENVEYMEHEDEFDIHPQEEINKRRLDLEDEDIDVLRIEPVEGNIQIDDDKTFRMPVQLDLIDSESEEEFVHIGRGEMRRKSPTGQGDYALDSGSGEDGNAAKKKGRRR